MRRSQRTLSTRTLAPVTGAQGALLDAYISKTVDLPEYSYKVRNPRELPQSLRGVVDRATAHGETWSCRAYGSHRWLFTCAMSLALSCERGAPVILARQFDEEADVRDAGTWRFDALGAWTRC